jgi:hypothetical protein
MRRPSSDQEIQSKEYCGRCANSNNYYAFRVERMQGQIDEPIRPHDEQSQGTDQVDRSAHPPSIPLNVNLRNFAPQATSWVAGISHA